LFDIVDSAENYGNIIFLGISCRFETMLRKMSYSCCVIVFVWIRL